MTSPAQPSGTGGTAELAPLAPGDTIIIECRNCEGTGWIERWTDTVDPWSGQHITHTFRCDPCKGTGEVEIETSARTLEDIEDEDRDQWPTPPSPSTC